MQTLLNLALLIQTTLEHSYIYFLKLSLLLFIILIVNRLTFYRVSILGIYPRKSWSLLGIICAPFIHANFDHLFFNLFPLIALSMMLMLYGFDFYWEITWALLLLSGGLIWGFARPGIHIGASALITAYWGFLVADMFYHPSIISILVGIICIYYFMGIFLGIFPEEEKVSWEGHLLGLISGIGLYLGAYYIPFLHHLIFEKPFWLSPPTSLAF